MNDTVAMLFKQLDRTGKTRKWAATLLGIDESTVSRWQSRQSDPHPFILKQIEKMVAKLEKEADAKD